MHPEKLRKIARGLF